MTIKNLLKISKNLLISLILLFPTLFCLSCQSTDVKNTENTEKQSVIQSDIQKISLNYYNSFTEMTKNNYKDPEIVKLLQTWETEAPTGDFYLCCFLYYSNVAITREDNSNVSIPDYRAYVVEGDYLIYRNMTVDQALFAPGINHLIQGVRTYPNRLDLWENLMSIFAELAFYNDLTNVICDFIDQITFSRDKGLTWYDVNDKSLSLRENSQGNHELFLTAIREYGTYIVDFYPFPNALENYQKIYRKVVKLYPYSPEAHNELGYSIGLSNPKEALQCFEKAYELDKTFTAAILNMAIYANVLKDQKKIEKYTELLKATGDTEKMKMLEQQVYFLNSQNN